MRALARGSGSAIPSWSGRLRRRNVPRSCFEVEVAGPGAGLQGASGDRETATASEGHVVSIRSRTAFTARAHNLWRLQIGNRRKDLRVAVQYYMLRNVDDLFGNQRRIYNTKNGTTGRFLNRYYSNIPNIRFTETAAESTLIPPHAA